MQSSSDIQGQGSEGLAEGSGESFNAVGSLASTLGQSVESANPSGLANPLPTGIPLSAGDIAVPQSPDNLRQLPQSENEMARMRVLSPVCGEASSGAAAPFQMS